MQTTFNHHCIFDFPNACATRVAASGMNGFRFFWYSFKHSCHTRRFAFILDDEISKMMALYSSHLWHMRRVVVSFSFGLKLAVVRKDLLVPNRVSLHHHSSPPKDFHTQDVSLKCYPRLASIGLRHLEYTLSLSSMLSQSSPSRRPAPAHLDWPSPS
jgi:hypothetical protein